MRRSHFLINAWRECEPNHSDTASFSNFASFLNTRTKTPIACLSPCISGSCISVATSGREATEVSAGKPKSAVRAKRMAPRRARIRALVRLQRRKHNLIIMYGHISRMSPCLGQCTRRSCRIPIRFWRGRVRGYSWRVKRTWGPVLNIDATIRVPRSSWRNLRDLA